MNCNRCGNAYTSEGSHCRGCGMVKTADTVLIAGSVRQMLGPSTPCELDRHDRDATSAVVGCDTMKCTHCGMEYLSRSPSCPSCGAPKTAEMVRNDLARDGVPSPSRMAIAAIIGRDREERFHRLRKQLSAAPVAAELIPASLVPYTKAIAGLCLVSLIFPPFIVVVPVIAFIHLLMLVP